MDLTVDAIGWGADSSDKTHLELYWDRTKQRPEWGCVYGIRTRLGNRVLVSLRVGQRTMYVLLSHWRVVNMEETHD